MLGERVAHFETQNARLRDRMGMAQLGDDQYFVAQVGTSHTYGPLTRRQVTEALHRGMLERDDRVWQPGMNTWQRAGVLFEAFFESEFGQHLAEKGMHQKNINYENGQLAVIHDLMFQLGGLVAIVVAQAVLPRAALAFVLVVPLAYWCWVALFKSGRSPGMTKANVSIVYLVNGRPLRGGDLVLWGYLSFTLCIAGGGEIFLKRKERRFLSNEILGCTWKVLNATSHSIARDRKAEGFFRKQAEGDASEPSPAGGEAVVQSRENSKGGTRVSLRDDLPQNLPLRDSARVRKQEGGHTVVAQATNRGRRRDRDDDPEATRLVGS